MTTGPGYHPPRPGEPDPTRKHPLGEHDDEKSVPSADEQSDNEIDARIGSSGMRPYEGNPQPDPENDELPGEWHDHEINEQRDR